MDPHPIELPFQIPRVPGRVNVKSRRYVGGRLLQEDQEDLQSSHDDSTQSSLQNHYERQVSQTVAMARGDGTAGIGTSGASEGRATETVAMDGTAGASQGITETAGQEPSTINRVGDAESSQVDLGETSGQEKSDSVGTSTWFHLFLLSFFLSGFIFCFEISVISTLHAHGHGSIDMIVAFIAR